MLEAVFEGGGAVDLATQTDLDPDAEAQRRVGGPVNLKPGEPLTVSSPSLAWFLPIPQLLDSLRDCWA